MALGGNINIPIEITSFKLCICTHTHTNTCTHTHTHITIYTSTTSSICMLFVCHNVSLLWLPKHDLNMDNNSRHAESLYKELWATKECWEWEKKTFLGNSKAISYPIINVSPVFLSKYKTTLCPMISQVPSVSFISPDFPLYCSRIPLPS